MVSCEIAGTIPRSKIALAVNKENRAPIVGNFRSLALEEFGQGKRFVNANGRWPSVPVMRGSHRTFAEQPIVDAPDYLSVCHSAIFPFSARASAPPDEPLNEARPNRGRSPAWGLQALVLTTSFD
jgi:hypothetical protein